MRLLEIVLKAERKKDLEKILGSDFIIEHWTYQSEDDRIVIKALVQDENAKELLTAIEKKSGHRVIIYPVEGTLPKVDNAIEKEEEKIRVGKFIVISKEELYNDIDEPISFSMNFILMVILSSFVAGIGILKDSIAIIIGAMVIAPFLGPNMSMAFGTSLGDWPIIRKSILTGVSASFIALIISMVWGFWTSDTSIISNDPQIGYQDIILALICGFAGVVSVISGQGSTLVGVMVAVALLPPLMRGGLFLGGGSYGAALNSFLIFGTNVICLNIAGIVTFYLAGIKPSRWWEKEKAIKKTRIALMAWTLALAILIVTIIIIKQRL